MTRPVRALLGPVTRQCPRRRAGQDLYMTFRGEPRKQDFEVAFRSRFASVLEALI